MAADTTQSFANHTKWVPAFHMIAFPILAILFFWGAWRVVTEFSVDRLMFLLLTVATLIALFLGRIFALTAQDRVIRLEMRLRMAQLLPADLRPRINELTPKQLIALRFAGDEELPALVRTVLVDGIHDQKAIKQMVKAWQADHLRV